MSTPTFLFPFSAADRAGFQHTAIRILPLSANGNSAIEESLVIEYEPSPYPVPPARVRPIFAGVMRFLADEGQTLPGPDDIQVDADGEVLPAEIAKYALTGTMIVYVINPSTKKSMRAAAIPILGEAPTIAWYGKIRTAQSFLGEALLGKSGLVRNPIRTPGGKKKVLGPKHRDWPRYALAYFLAGKYEAVLTADNCAKLPMPEVVSVTSGSSPPKVTLQISLAGEKKMSIASPDETKHELMLPQLFLQHLKGKEWLDEAPIDDPVIRTVLDNRTSVDWWTLELSKRLEAVGFELPTEKVVWAVREFQYYAGLDRVAFEKVDEEAVGVEKLSGRANNRRYSGTVCGQANRETRRLALHWVAESFRCPLRVLGYKRSDLDTTTGLPKTLAADYGNLWMHDALPRGFRAFKADFVDHDAIKAADLIAVGELATLDGDSGPISLVPGDKYYAPSENAEVRPARLLNMTDEELLKPLADQELEKIRQAKASTFRIVRAISEAECYGYFDIVNAYDAGNISLPIYHWAAFQPHKGSNELGGVAAYLKHLQMTAGRNHSFDRLFKNFGLGISSSPGWIANGTRLAVLCFIKDRSGNYAFRSEDAKFLSTWHFFSRWIKICRSDQEFSQAVWHLARQRIDRVLFTSWTKDSSDKIKDHITSELLVAAIVRWHTNRPGDIIKGNCATAALRKFYSDAKDEVGSSDPTKLEKKMFEIILAELGAEPKDSYKYKLFEQFTAMKDPPWIEFDATTGEPKIGSNNPGRYRLLPKLRLLSQDAGSFKPFLNIP